MKMSAKEWKSITKIIYKKSLTSEKYLQFAKQFFFFFLRLLMENNNNTAVSKKHQKACGLLLKSLHSLPSRFLFSVNSA